MTQTCSKCQLTKRLCGYKVVVIQPEEILCITNLGSDGVYNLPDDALEQLRQDTGCRRVYGFAADVDFVVIRRGEDE